jgi:hypothetical protein
MSILGHNKRKKGVGFVWIRTGTCKGKQKKDQNNKWILSRSRLGHLKVNKQINKQNNKWVLLGSGLGLSKVNKQINKKWITSGLAPGLAKVNKQTNNKWVCLDQDRDLQR